MGERSARTAWRGLFENSGFVRLWLGQAVSQIGDGLSGLALLVVVYRLTHTASAVAALSILISLPQVVLGLHAGVLADRWDRRRVMIASDLARGALVLGLVVASARDSLPAMYVLACAQAAAAVLFEPARAALLPSLVDAERLLEANSVANSTRIACGVLGSTAAGLLLTLPRGAMIAFGLDAASFMVSAGALLGIRTERHAPGLHEPQGTDRRSEPGPDAGAPAAMGGLRTATDAAPLAPSGITAELVAGLRLVFTNPAMTRLLVMFSITVLGMGAVNVLFVPFLMNELHGSTSIVGLVRGVQLAGMIGGGLLLGRAGRLPPDAILTLGILGLGPLLALIGIAPHWTALLPLIGLVGLCSSAVQSGSMTLIQRTVPARMLGRAESALDTVLTVVMLISMASAGIAADRVGTRAVFVVAGGLALVAGLSTGVRAGLRPAKLNA